MNSWWWNLTTFIDSSKKLINKKSLRIQKFHLLHLGSSPPVEKGSVPAQSVPIIIQTQQPIQQPIPTQIQPVPVPNYHEQQFVLISRIKQLLRPRIFSHKLNLKHFIDSSKKVINKKRLRIDFCQRTPFLPNQSTKIAFSTGDSIPIK